MTADQPDDLRARRGRIRLSPEALAVAMGIPRGIIRHVEYDHLRDYIVVDLWHPDLAPQPEATEAPMVNFVRHDDGTTTLENYGWGRIRYDDYRTLTQNEAITRGYRLPYTAPQINLLRATNDVEFTLALREEEDLPDDD